MTSWSELYPEGRKIYYEGSNPEDFIRTIKRAFGFDPSKDNPKWKSEYSFFCPAELLNEIYGDKWGNYPLGS